MTTKLVRTKRNVSRNAFRRANPFRNSEFGTFLNHLNIDGVQTYYEDFRGVNGVTLDGNWEANGKVNGTSAAVTPSRDWLTLVTGTTDDGYAAQALLNLDFYGNKDAVAACRVYASAITTLKFEFGFADAVADDAGVVNVLGNATTNPSWTATDAAVFCFDTDSTLSYLQCCGVANGTTPGTSGSGKTVTGIALPTTAATAITLTVQLRQGDAYFYIDNVFVAKVTDAITSTVALTPWFFAQARAGSASRTVYIDYLYAEQSRIA